MWPTSPVSLRTGGENILSLVSVSIDINRLRRQTRTEIGLYSQDFLQILNPSQISSFFALHKCPVAIQLILGLLKVSEKYQSFLSADWRFVFTFSISLQSVCLQNIQLWQFIKFCEIPTERIWLEFKYRRDDSKINKTKRGTTPPFFQSCWSMRDHIGRPNGISNPDWHLPQMVPRVDQTTGSVHPQPTLPNCEFCLKTEPTTRIGRLIKSSSSTQATLEQSPIQVLTELNVAWLQWSVSYTHLTLPTTPYV